MATKKELAFMLAVKNLPCVDCLADNGCDFDHIVIGYRLGHMYGDPRCYDCHRGNNQKHSTIKQEMAFYKETCAAVGVEYILPPRKEFRFWEKLGIS